MPSLLITPATPAGAQRFACVWSPLAVKFGLRAIFDAEADAVGVSFSNLNGGANTVVPFGFCLLMLVADMVWMALMALWLEQVVPSEFGTPQRSKLFCLSSKFWRDTCADDSAARVRARALSVGGASARVGTAPVVDETVLLNAASDDGDDRVASVDSDLQEAVSAELHAHEAVRIRALRREFDKTDQSVNSCRARVRSWCGQRLSADEQATADEAARPAVAVDALDLSLYAGQITALLGHNGASGGA